jgi:hypothetical protein
MDRPDLGVDLRAALRRGDAAETWARFLAEACAPRRATSVEAREAACV